MSFKNHAIKKLPNQQDILGCLTDHEIFVRYLGGIPKKPISSPLRDDETPSFSVFKSDRHDKLMFKDFATGETGDAFVFVMRLFNYSRITDAFTRIASDFMLDQFETKTLSATGSRRALKTYVDDDNIGKVRKGRIEIKVKVRKWSLRDKKYWFDKYGFTQKQLRHCGIFPVSHYFVNGYCKVAEDLAYAFVEEKDGIQTFKIYQPLSTDYKWINNNDFSTWELWTQLPRTGFNLIITSSRKDAMIIKSLFPPHILTACALQSEKVNPKDSVMEEVVGRFDSVFILYDNDQDKETNWGRVAGKKLADLYSLHQIEIPDKYCLKDISDFYERHGRTETIKLIKELLTQIKSKTNGN